MLKLFSRSWIRWCVGMGSAFVLGGGVMFLAMTRSHYHPQVRSPFSQLQGTQPLVMKGGDPYIRALMRTITASEANVSQPYTILYGGQRFSDFSRHPERCVPIVTGPNTGNCTTAAGRYQFLDITWQEKAENYHPNPSGMLWWKEYSFAPEYQDAVVHAWLSDPTAWEMNISQQLREGNIQEVLKHLSATWTSLGYGIETNSMSRHLPSIYEKMLQEELQKGDQVES